MPPITRRAKRLAYDKTQNILLLQPDVLDSVLEAGPGGILFLEDVVGVCLAFRDASISKKREWAVLTYAGTISEYGIGPCEVICPNNVISFQGGLLVSDSLNGRVQHMALQPNPSHQPPVAWGDEPDDEPVAKLSLLRMFGAPPSTKGVRPWRKGHPEFGGLYNWPVGLASDGTHLFIAEKSKDGQPGRIVKHHLQSGKEVYFNEVDAPHSLALKDGTLFVSETDRFGDGINEVGRILVLDSKTMELRAIIGRASLRSGTKPDLHASFTHPTGICIAGGELFVCDMQTHSIHAIYIKEYLVNFDCASLRKRVLFGEYNFPMGITTDGERLYVSETGPIDPEGTPIGESRVLVLSLRGDPLQVVDFPPWFNGDVFGLCVHNSAVYVTDSMGSEMHVFQMRRRA